jgi:GT2 family glycosyltransferase
LKNVLDSQGYQDKRKQQETERYEYVTLLYRYLLDRKAEESEVKSWVESEYSPLQLWKIFLDSQGYQDKKEQREINLSSILGRANYALIGEEKPLGASSVLQWYKRAAESLIAQIPQPKFLTTEPKSKQTKTQADLPFAVTIVTSLYKGEKYIQSFLENIISQTIFCQCQLFIVDANSPQKEYEIIKNYLDLYPNIRYLRLEKTIGIYEAWNLAIKESDSEFITNANVDDLHRDNALELKVKALRDTPEVDVAYSDVYYSFLANLPFEIGEKCNLKTNFPTANKFNLLKFNSPHNSPIWRRSLHQKIGYFDPTYKSAGDYEFWLRAAFSGSYFLKIPEPLVVYYYNPKGMSTKKKTPSIDEAIKIRKMYQNLLDLT